VRIADGDTFTLLTGDSQQVKVRLHGIDAPERGQDFGQVARQKLSDLVFGNTVFITEKDKDRYGRTVAIVYNSQRKCINEEMLRSGLAWHYKEYDDNRDWASLENSARRSKTGLWAHPEPTPPWQWRKKGKAVEQ
jgi:endonuclease YncB( thermonuclease family)